MIQNNRNLRILFSIFATFALLLSFQNCSKTVLFTSLDSIENLTSKGNGTGYEGKPTYYNMVPGFTCENKIIPRQKLELDGENYLLTENNRLSCFSAQSEIPKNQVDTSIFQTDVVGYKEKIYEYYPTAQSSIPANLVEVWCRDRKDEQGVESLVYYDRIQKQAQVRLYYGMQTPAGAWSMARLSDFSVSRVLDPSLIRISNGSDFSLDIHRDQPVTETGLFIGELKTSVRSQEISVSCRLGGDIDPSIWPVQQVIDSKVEIFKQSPDHSYFAFSTKVKAGGPSLLFKIENGTVGLLIPDPFQYGVRNFIFAPNSKMIYYTADHAATAAAELHQVSRDGTLWQRISDPLVDDAGNVVDLEISSDGSHLSYRDSSHLTVPGSSNRMVRAINLDANQMPSASIAISPVAPTAPAGSPGWAWYNRSALSSKYNLLAYHGGGQIYSDLYLSKVDGSNTQKRTPNFQNANLHIPWNAYVYAPPESDYVIISVQDSTNATTPLQPYAIALNGNQVFPVGGAGPAGLAGMKNTPGLLLGKKNNVLIRTIDSLGVSTYPLWLANMDLQQSWQIPNLDHPTFNDSGSAVFGTFGGELLSVSTSSGATTKICSLVGLKVLRTALLSSGNFLAAGYNAQTKSLVIWKVDVNQQSCQSLATVFAPDFFAIADFKISFDEQKAVIVTDRTEALVSRDLYYVPLDKKLPVRVNSPVHGSGKIKDVQFLPNSQAIYYWGDQIRAGEDSLFFWEFSE